VEKIIIYFKKAFIFFLELLFPSRCLGCHQTNDVLCNNCLSTIRLAERPTESDIMALYDYRDPIIKKAIWQLKYYHSPYLGQKLGLILYEGFLEEIINIQIFSQGSPILVIPVPISAERKKDRGYNQSEIIAKNFCLAANSNIFDLANNIIFKNKITVAQAKIKNRNERLKNIKGAFEIKNSALIKNRTIIIIDDVTTTGGTILEIIKILKKAGAKKIVGLAVAH
jgi:ComF family protein